MQQGQVRVMRLCTKSVLYKSYWNFSALTTSKARGQVNAET